MARKKKKRGSVVRECEKKPTGVGTNLTKDPFAQS